MTKRTENHWEGVHCVPEGGGEVEIGQFIDPIQNGAAVLEGHGD
jgi:hypothetical protein